LLIEKKEIVRKGYNKVAKTLQEIFGLEKEGHEKLNLLAVILCQEYH